MTTENSYPEPVHIQIKHHVEDADSSCAVCATLRERRTRAERRRRRLLSYLESDL